VEVAPVHPELARGGGMVAAVTLQRRADLVEPEGRHPISQAQPGRLDGGRSRCAPRAVVAGLTFREIQELGAQVDRRSLDPRWEAARRTPG